MVRHFQPFNFNFQLSTFQLSTDFSAAISNTDNVSSKSTILWYVGHASWFAGQSYWETFWPCTSRGYSKANNVLYQREAEINPYLISTHKDISRRKKYQIPLFVLHKSTALKKNRGVGLLECNYTTNAIISIGERKLFSQMSNPDPSRTPEKSKQMTKPLE